MANHPICGNNQRRGEFGFVCFLNNRKIKDNERGLETALVVYIGII